MSSSRTTRSRVLERARRLSVVDHPEHDLEALRHGRSVEETARATGLPRSVIDGVESFYDLLSAAPGARRCTGTACTFPGGSVRSEAPADGPEVHCVGQCYSPPAHLGRETAPIPRRCLAAEPVVLRHLLGDSGVLGSMFAEYEQALEPEEILQVLEASGLRGRGGAAFPTGAKWRAARAAHGERKFVVANGDEGDPGSYVDRLLLEEDPHAVLAGMVACARAVGATHGIVYVRGEYPQAAVAVQRAIDEARSAGFLGTDFDVEVKVGAGSYVCGEETALLRSIEGLRGEPSPRPPYPTTHGLWGQPTVVQNVETLALVPWLLRHRCHPGRKAVCLSGAVRCPGVVEIDLETSLRTVLEAGGDGAPANKQWKMALVGGPMGRVVPAGWFDVKLEFDSLPGMGHGGVVVLDDTVSARCLAEHLFAFARSESCGSCTPCRVGTAQLEHMRSREDLERLLEVLEMGSLCGFGQAVPRPLRDLLTHFGDEVMS